MFTRRIKQTFEEIEAEMAEIEQLMDEIDS